MNTSPKSVRFDDDTLWCQPVRWPHHRRAFGVVPPLDGSHARATRRGRIEQEWVALGRPERGYFGSRIAGRSGRFLASRDAPDRLICYVTLLPFALGLARRRLAERSKDHLIFGA